MARAKINSIRFIPPVAVARLGNSDTPLEAFSWVQDPRLYGAAKTIIHPEPSLEILPDGSAEPYLPNLIRFRDGNGIRPVCPFLELRAEVKDHGVLPLTPELLEGAEMDLSQLQFKVTAANIKAKRRTGDAGCAFEARLEVRANDHKRHDLLAWSHANAPNPLVRQEQPIWLGAFQVIRPVRRKPKFEIWTNTIRVRFTPGHGAVYGPPFAVSGQTIGSRAKHEIVTSENRILNPASIWCNYNWKQDPPYPIPLPPDIYDGADDVDRGDFCWGVVDDTCDAVITASLSTYFGSGAPTASARVLVGPPHYAPDRRHLFSVAEDLADRDPESLANASGTGLTVEQWLEEVTDVFRRIWETACHINLERHRTSDLAFNLDQKNRAGFPLIDQDSMTAEDKVNGHPLLSQRFLELAAKDGGDGADGAPLLPKAEYARTRHAELSIPEVLLEFMVQNPVRFKELLRPPFRRMSDPDIPDEEWTASHFRDPRFRRSYLYDARMPPFLRDCDFAPLSLSRRQWDLLFAENKKGPLMQQAYAAIKKKK